MSGGAVSLLVFVCVCVCARACVCLDCFCALSPGSAVLLYVLCLYLFVLRCLPHSH